MDSSTHALPQLEMTSNGTAGDPAGGGAAAVALADTMQSLEHKVRALGEGSMPRSTAQWHARACVAP